MHRGLWCQLTVDVFQFTPRFAQVGGSASRWKGCQEYLGFFRWVDQIVAHRQSLFLWMEDQVGGPLTWHMAGDFLLCYNMVDGEVVVGVDVAHGRWLKLWMKLWSMINSCWWISIDLCRKDWNDFPFWIGRIIARSRWDNKSRPMTTNPGQWQ